MLNDPGLTHFAESSTISRPRRPLTDIRKQPTMYSRKTEVLGDSEQNKTRKMSHPFLQPLPKQR